MTPPLWTGFLHDIEEQNVLLTMPKFEFESKFRLDKTLKKMGMPNAFDESESRLLRDERQIVSVGWVPGYRGCHSQGLRIGG